MFPARAPLSRNFAKHISQNFFESKNARGRAPILRESVKNVPNCFSNARFFRFRKLAKHVPQFLLGRLPSVACVLQPRVFGCVHSVACFRSCVFGCVISAACFQLCVFGCVISTAGICETRSAISFRLCVSSAAWLSRCAILRNAFRRIFRKDERAGRGMQKRAAEEHRESMAKQSCERSRDLRARPKCASEAGMRALSKSASETEMQALPIAKQRTRSPRAVPAWRIMWSALSAWRVAQNAHGERGAWRTMRSGSVSRETSVPSNECFT